MVHIFWFFIGFSFLIGASIGSFLNVCIARIPEKKSIVSPPSNCPKCGHGIKFYDNIPVLSYLILLGRCRHCKTSISMRYPLVELLTAILSVLLMMRFGPSISYLVYFCLVSALITITFIDLDHRIIPDIISLPAIPIGFLASFVLVQISWLDSLIGILAGGGSLMLVAIIYEKLTGHEGMGGRSLYDNGLITPRYGNRWRGDADQRKGEKVCHSLRPVSFTRGGSLYVVGRSAYRMVSGALCDLIAVPSYYSISVT